MPASGELQVQQLAEGSLTVTLTGSWKLGQVLPSADEVLHAIEGMPGAGNIAFDTRELTDWDSGLLIFLKQLSEFSAQKKITFEESGLPQGARKLLKLAEAVPAKKDARKAEGKVAFLTHVGSETVDFFRAAGEMLAFIGDTVIAFLNLLRGRAQFRKSDLWLIVESCGGQALPIVSLICFLVGLILAFIGAIQLELFGAQIYVADLVGIAMVRLMAAIMTGIVMAGRTGGFSLARAPDGISLADIYRAVEDETIFRMHKTDPHSDCPIGAQICKVLAGPLQAAESALAASLAGTTLKDISTRIAAPAIPASQGV